MRFYSKITPSLLLNSFAAILWIGLGVVSTSSSFASFHRLVAAVWFFILLTTLLSQAFCFWEIQADGLFERRLWSTRTIPFEQIVRVAPAALGKRLRPGWLSADFFRPGPLSDQGTLSFAPAHPNQLIAALRHAAPQAAFAITQISPLLRET